MVRLRHLTPADYRIMPWKNGLGATTELAIDPPALGSELDRFDWRVSIATVASDGPFSSFAGYDRILMVLEGAGMVLDHGLGEHGPGEHGPERRGPGEYGPERRGPGEHGPGDQGPEGGQKRLERLEPYGFSGDWTTYGRLVDGPAQDFNVITRRGRIDASLAVHTVERRLELPFQLRGTTLLFCLSGRVRLEPGSQGAEITLEAREMLRIDADEVEGGAAGGRAVPVSGGADGVLGVVPIVPGSVLIEVRLAPVNRG